MSWGTFDLEDVVHVAPCDASGDLDEDHTLDVRCACHPVVERACVKTGRVYSRPMVIHRTDSERKAAAS